MPILTATDLHKSFGLQRILSGATLSIHTGERVGLVGVNGSGKSTLARILGGIEPVDSGTIARRRGAEILYLEQDPTFDPALTPRAIVAGGLAAWTDAKARHERASAALARGHGDMAALVAEQEQAAADVDRLGGWDMDHQVEAIMGHVGVLRPDAPVGTLSGGERRRTALARILVARPALAILDEPSNHLDVETVEWLEGYLLDEYKGALLLITHDRYLLDRVAQRTLEIDQGLVYSYDGGYEDYLEAKAERLAFEARTEANRQNFLRRELEWLRRQPKARTTKQKARIDRAEAAKAAPAPKQEKAVELALDSMRAGKTILELRKLTLSIGNLTLVKDLDFILTSGERLGIVGRNGTGKTTLLRAILGDLAPAKGEVVMGKNTKVAYFDQHRAQLDDNKSIFDNVAGDNSRIEVGGQQFDVRGYLERFLFDSYKQRQPVGSLSGGERARVALAKILSRGANLVILDEPTNDLDVATLGALEQLLLEFDGCAITVTHDRYFLNRIATSILAFQGDGEVVRYAGNYDDFRTQRARAEEIKAEALRAAAPLPAAKEKPREAPKVKLTYAEQKELDALPDKIEAADKAVSELESQLADPTLYATRGNEVPGLTAELEKRKAEAARLLTRWEELETKREGAGK
ncbi:MAG: ABC-F family ATP-binding cassette domain-containing protein [Minicystis sp.]